MNIGDKVRSIRGNEEGIITNILPHNEIEVEIEDGFRIPFQARDLAVVSKTENELLGKSDLNRREEKIVRRSAVESFAEKGVYLAMISVNDKLLDVILINNTNLDLVYTFGTQNTDKYKGIKCGVLEGKSYFAIDQVNMDKFENWGSFLFQYILHRNGPSSLNSPKVKKLRFKGASFFKSKSNAPLINQDAFLFQLDNQEQEIKPTEIIESFYESDVEQRIKKVESRNKIKKNFSKEVDLHIEKIQPLNAIIPDNEILKIQLETFEKELDKAIFLGVDTLTLIHGVGNGILKEEIQKRLAGNPNVDYFKDAQKGKFGYGATELKLK